MKKNKIIYLLGLSFLISGCTAEKEKTKTIEYGDDFQINEMILEDFNDSYEIVMQDDELWEYLNSDKKDYIPVGNYKVKVENKNKKVVYTLKVKDTIKPEFKTFTETVHAGIGENDIDWNQYYKADDLSKVMLKVDDSDVDYENSGKYTIVVKLEDASKNVTKKEAILEIGTGKVSETTKKDGATYVNGILIVNKKHSIPSDFASGEDPVAGAKIRELIADMQSQGYNISIDYSGYRSNAYQIGLYNGYVQKSGREEADMYSARPGFSEHETGLCFDLIDGNGALVESEREAKWIEENAHKYGFIVRYPLGKEDITGYIYEPWHLRYVGNKAAKEIYEQGLTLEEYLDVPGGKYYD